MRPTAILMLLLAGVASTATPAAIAEAVRATRLGTNPLVTVKTSPVLGDNVNGPSVIRVPDWASRPLGRYYMYFAHHMGHTIRLAYADSVAGPWRIYEPGVLHVRDTAFSSPRPDPPEGVDDFYTHVASPEVQVDDARKKILLWYHGWWTNGEPWPGGGRAGTRAWANSRGYGQFTELAESGDGLTFTVRPNSLTRASYLRVFRWRGGEYAMARLGRLGRAATTGAPFELGPNPFRGGPYANRVRHVAVLRRGAAVWVFFSAIGDAPERILASRIDLRGDWQEWRAEAPVEVLRPEAAYECPDLPVAPSLAGAVKGPVRQLRDPAVFEDGGRVWLFYSVCGEQGIAAAGLRFEP